MQGRREERTVGEGGKNALEASRGDEQKAGEKEMESDLREV